MAASAPAPRAWLFGPIPDLLLGCGALYLFVTLAYVFSDVPLPGNQTRALLVLALSTPHYGATILRVYEQRQERRAYALFAVWATLLVAGSFVAGLMVETIGAWLVTIFFTWSPWHYTGQNYGIAVMFLRRRGVEVTPQTKRVVYASFILSYVLTFFSMHVGGGDVTDLPAGYAGGGFRLQSFGIPVSLGALLIPASGLAYCVTTGAAALLLLRRASLRAITPWAMITFTQALWFTVPLAFQYGGISTGVASIDAEFRRQWFLWIALGHSVQYLWITSYYARNEDHWHGMFSYFAKIVVAGNAVWTLPVVMVGLLPALFGASSYDGGLALLLAAAINIHHFILDGAIWKLRDGRIARVLIRSSGQEQGLPSAGSDGALLRSFVWGVAWFGTLIAVFVLWQRMSFPGKLAQGDFEGAVAVMDRLALVGHDRARDRLRMGTTLASLGYPTAAEREIERSISMQPSITAYSELGRLRERRGDREGAVRAYREGLLLEPNRVGLLHRQAVLLIELGQPERATELLEHALRQRPDHLPSQQALTRARLAPAP
jgi:tetratricopeptide (TPR) repeat protein